MKKTFKMLQKISISDKCCSSELSINQRNLKKILSFLNSNRTNYNFAFPLVKWNYATQHKLTVITLPKDSDNSIEDTFFEFLMTFISFLC